MEICVSLNLSNAYITGCNVSNITDELNNSATGEFRLSDFLGPKRQSLAQVIPITIAYCVIFITGITGNIATCVVIALNPYMHTATNYYLFNLAIADLLVLIFGLPMELYTFWSSYPWIFGEAFCLFRPMIAESCTNASVLTITAFTIERYIAICHPMRTKTMSSLSRAIKAIAIIWIISCSSSLPLSIQFGVNYLYDTRNNTIPGSAICNIKPEEQNKTAFEISIFLFFCTPMTVISVLYGFIAMKLLRSSSRRSPSAQSHGFHQKIVDKKGQQMMKSRRTAIKMLVAVVVAFFVCWAPFHAQRLMTIYVTRWTKHLFDIQTILYYVSGVLYYVSSTINPILYHTMSLKYRKALKDTITRVCKRKKKQTTYLSMQFRNRSSYYNNSNSGGASVRPSLRVYEIHGRVKTSVTIEPTASSSSSIHQESNAKLN